MKRTILFMLKAMPLIAMLIVQSTMGQSVSLSIETPEPYYINNGRLVCPGDEITFVCETRGSSTIAWSSEEYIGPGGAQIPFSAIAVPNNTKYGIGDTVATFTANIPEDGVLRSTLRVTATLMSSVRCIHDDESSRTISFSMIAPPNVSRNVSLIVEHTAEDCVVNISWRSPENLAEAPVNKYTITVKFNDTAVTNANVSKTIKVDATIEPERDFSSLFIIPYCHSGSVTLQLQATNTCGHFGPIYQEEIALEEDCCITKVLPESNIDIITDPDTTTMSKTSDSVNKNAAEIPEASLGMHVAISVLMGLWCPS